MAYKRKYQQYKIIVVKQNGQKEITDVSKYDVETDSYKDMLQTYKDIKEEYKDVPVEISFCGVSDNGQLGIIFTREGIKNKQESFKDELLNKTNEELTDILKDVVDTMKQKANSQIAWGHVEKDINVLNHISMSFDINQLNKMSETEKNDFLLKLGEANIKRKEILNLQGYNDVLKSYMKTINEMNGLCGQLRKYLDTIKIAEEKGKEKYTIDNYDNIIVKISFVNFTDRFNKQRELEKKKEYDRIVIDEKNKELVCYKRCILTHK